MRVPEDEGTVGWEYRRMGVPEDGGTGVPAFVVVALGCWAGSHNSLL